MAKNNSVLIIDDEEDVREVFSDILSEKYEVYSAANSKEALELLENLNPSTTLLDFRLGKEDGIEVLKKIKKDSPECPVVMVTGFGEKRTILSSLKVGAFDFIEKPLQDNSVLLESIEKAIKYSEDYVLRKKRKATFENKFITFIRKSHKWLALLVGIPVLLWTFSGFYMAITDHHKLVDIKNRTHNPTEMLILPNDFSNMELSYLRFMKSEGIAKEVRISNKFGKVIYEINGIDGTRSLFDSATGQKLKIDKNMAKEIGISMFKGKGKINSIKKIGKGEIKIPLNPFDSVFKRRGPAWQIIFDNPEKTHIYISTENGDLLSWNNSTWRFYDFMYALHIMDFKGRQNINNPYLIGFSFFTLLMTLSGLFLSYIILKKRDFKLFLKPFLGKARKAE